MTPSQWEHIKDVFDAALELSPDEQSRFLAQACNGDEAIRLEVERLLGEYDRAGSFMETAPRYASLNSCPRDESRTFAASEIVAGRFRIMRFIAQGGMGEVYEAEDLDLHERVALKTVRPLIAADQKALEVVKREIHHARKVTHPNVNRIFDLERHCQPGGDEVAFLTMELLDGETLAERLKRVRRMTISEAWPLIQQMAAGLGAAHHAGIVHRDFKPGNVMLVDTPARAVITDFGLSRAVDTQAASGEPSTGSASGVVGTPPYIAPEQLEGGPVTPATDVYALGVVLYEMLTGTLPFSGQSPLSLAMKRLKESPVSLHAHVPGLDTKWQEVTLRCLERDPSDRFATAEDVVAALRGEPLGRANHARRRTGLLTGLLLAVSVATFWWLFPRDRLPAPVLSNRVKLNDDGRQKGWGALMAADASWLYFEERVGFRTVLAKAPLFEGQTQKIETPFGNVSLLDISPDQAELLVASPDPAYSIQAPPGPIWRLTTSGLSPHRLGDVTARSATWSPDGRHIAYADGRNLWEVDAEGGSRRRIFTASAHIEFVRWSPDGATLVFETLGPRTEAIDWKVRPDGSGLIQWAPRLGGLAHALLRGPTWAPDGKYLLVRTDDGTAWLASQSGGFFSGMRKGPIELRLGPGSRLTGISKDGNKAYAVESGTQKNEFMTYERRTRPVVPLAKLSGISANTPAFSRDGRWIAYSEQEDSRLWRSKADGTDPVPLTSSTLNGALPAWSPDGIQIAFMGGRQGKESRIYLIALDGGEPKPLVPDNLWQFEPQSHWQGAPTWSLDGKQIAFGENGRNFPISPSCAIHIFNRDTQRLITIPHSEGLWTARWSPTGRYLAALTRDDEKLMLYDFRTQKWIQLDDGFIGDNPAWSHGGRYLYYLKPYAEPPAIMRLRVPGGKPERVADLSILDQQRGSFTLWSSLAPGDIPLLIRRDYNDEIYAYDLKLPQ